MITGPNLDFVSGRDLDRVHVGIRENHTSKKHLVSDRNLVNFGLNLFGYPNGTKFYYFICRLVIFTYQPHHTHKTTPVSPFPPDATQGNHKTKKWGQSDKDNLTDLIQVGLVDIENLSLDNINTVRQDHFRHRSVKNFRQNFKDFSAAFNLKTEYSSARRNKGGRGKLRCMVLIIIQVRVL